MRVLELLAVIGAALAPLGCDSQSPAGELNVPAAVAGGRHVVTATDLIELREIGGMLGAGLSISPDGNFAAFEMHQADVAANNYRVAWFVASINGLNVPVNVGDGGDPTLFKYVQPSGRVQGAWITDYAKWSPDSRGIAYRKRVNGETHVWWSSRVGRESRQLTYNAADVEEFYWNEDGSGILFTTDAERAVIRETEESRFRNGHVYDYDKEWSTIDGRPHYPRYRLTGGEPRLWVLDIETESERPATEAERAEFERLKQGASTLDSAPKARKIVWTEDKKGVAWAQPDYPEKQGISPPQTVYALLPDDDGEPIRCAAEACTGLLELSGLLSDGLHWDAIDGEVYFVRKEGTSYSKRSLYGWHVEDGSVRKILTTHEWISDCSVIRDRAICFRETATYPRTIISIDLGDGSISTLVDANPEFRNVALGDVEFLEWKNALGYTTFGYLVKPPDYISGRRYPLVFVGYRAKRALLGGTGNEYPVHLLAANGFIVLVYDKPLPHEALEVYSDPLDIGRARWGPDLFDVRMPLASFKSAVKLLDQKGLVDPDRVAITGLSAGASDVIYSLIHSSLFAAAIASGTSSGPNSGVLVGFSKDFRKYREAIGAGPYPGPHSFLRPHMSLALNTESIEAPLLVNVSDSEHPWVLEEIAALMKHDKPVEMIVHPDEGHVKWHPAHRSAIYERNVDWLNFWLRGIDDPHPAKASQYVRWQRLRKERAAN